VTIKTTSPAQPELAAPSPANARIDGLDGIRALGVIGVILYHTDLSWSPAAGFLGVDVFFTLSGFLITTLLLREYRATHRIDLRQFYLRRARRLLPAMWLLLLFASAAGLLVSHDTIQGLRGDVPAAFLYVSNWWQIYHGQSYFELIGRPAPLQHLWSLSIEEQFYIFWPALVIYLLVRGRVRLLARVSLMLAAAVTAWMWVLAAWHGYPADADPSRGYFGLDSHSMGLFAGAALAAYWNPWQMKARAPRVVTETMGFGALALLVVAFFQVTESTAFLYRGGFLLVAVLTTTLIYAVVDRRTLIGSLFSTAPMQWIGERSYGLYLWHWPIFGLLRPGLDLPLGEIPCLVLRLAATLVVTELSYRFVERPIRAGQFKAWSQSERRRALIGAVVAGSSAFVLALLLYVRPNPHGTMPDDVAAAIGIGLPRPTHAPSGKNYRPADVPATKPASGAARTAPSADRDASDQDVGEVLALGDSVMLGASRALTRVIDGLQVDAEVGRQARDIVARVKELKAQDQLPPRVIVHMGTNGYVTEQQLRVVLDALADRDEVILVNAFAPRRWISVNNDMFRQVAATHPNVTVLDWFTLSTDHPEYFVSDHVHLSTAGLKVFAAEIVQAGGFAAPGVAPVAHDGDLHGIVVGTLAEPVHHLQADVRAAEELGPEAPTPAVADAIPLAEGQIEVDYTTPASRPTSPPLHANSKPIAVDPFWDHLATCETGGDWTHKGSSSGGLAIRGRAWRSFGGAEFAKTAGEATREQQITVANRISTQGYSPAHGRSAVPVGFAGWNCVRTVGRPLLVVHTPESILAQVYQWGQASGTVEELQAVLDVPRSGRYDLHTWRAHLKVLASHEFPRNLAPDSPLIDAGGRTGR
jgi:peptidoglycan/LPS O-acetylase OafA/YrhL